MKITNAVFAAALVLAYGCSSSGSDTVSENPVDLSGNSLGVALVTGGTAYPPDATFPITFVLVQTGDTVTGEYDMSATARPTSGAVAGTISGRTFSFTMTQTSPCAGAYAASTTVESSGIAFSGPYSGDDCFGTTQAWFSASK